MSRTVTNPHGLPEPYVRAVSQARVPERGKISVTELLQPAQMRSLELQYEDEIEETADSRIDLFFGLAVHEYLARFAGPDALAEETLTYTVDGWLVHGTFDYAEWLGVDDGVLTDWKTTRVRALKYDKPEWEAQVNLYAHLMRLNGYPLSGVQVKAFLKDWDRSLLNQDGYPRAPIVHVPVPLWDAERAHAYLLGRLRLHKQAARGYYPPCTDEERWQHTSYAVVSKREGAQRATRVFDTREQAEQFSDATVGRPRKPDDWYEVEERRSEPLRCKFYCAAAPWCEQWAGESAPPESGLRLVATA